MEHHVLAGWLAHVGPFSYLVVFVLVFAESGLLLLLPGETVVLLAGAMAARHELSLPLLAAVAACAAVAGDACGYLLGRGPARRRFQANGRFLMLKQADVRRVESAMQRWGPWAVVVSRFVSLLRVTVPFVCGLTDYPPRRFFPFNVPAGIVWGVGISVLGEAGGRALAHAHRVIGHLSLAVGGAALVLVLLWNWRRRHTPVTLTSVNW